MSSSTSSMLPLAGKTAIITGASKGIGHATSLALAALGANIIVNFSRDIAAADNLVAQLNSNSRGTQRATAVQADVGTIAGVRSLVARTVELHQKVDIVVANAGLMTLQDLAHTTEEDVAKMFAINVTGPLFLAQAAAPYLESGGRLVFMSTSVCGASAVTPPYLTYAMCKGAVEQMVRLLARDLGRRGIMVNAIAPGPTGTELFYGGKSEQLVNVFKGMHPLNRIGTPEEVGSAVAYLCGEGGNWVNGQVLRVNGGFV